jgi:hypothetical protein
VATLMAVYNSDGLVGRCDARCYLGHGDSCDCCCGGVNHGVGLERAQENTREIFHYVAVSLPAGHELRDQ